MRSAGFRNASDVEAQSRSSPCLLLTRAELKTLRNEKRLTLSRLGGESGLSTALLSKLESDLMIPTLPTLAKICHVYGIGLDYFFSNTEHHFLSITRKAHISEEHRQLTAPRTTPLHLPSADSRQVSKVVELPAGSTLTLTEAGRRTELTGYVLDGTLRVTSVGALDRLTPGDCIVLETDAAVFCSAEDTRCRVLVVLAR